MRNRRKIAAVTVSLLAASALTFSSAAALMTKGHEGDSNSWTADFTGVDVSAVNKVVADVSCDTWANGIIGYSSVAAGDMVSNQADTGSSQWILDGIAGDLNWWLEIQFWWVSNFYDSEGQETDKSGTASLNTVTLYDADGNVLKVYGEAGGSTPAPAPTPVEEETGGDAEEVTDADVVVDDDDAEGESEEIAAARAAGEAAAARAAAQYASVSAVVPSATSDDTAAEDTSAAEETAAEEAKSEVDAAIEAAEDGIATIDFSEDNAVLSEDTIASLIENGVKIEIVADDYTVTIDPDDVSEAKDIDVTMDIDTSATKIKGVKLPEGSIVIKPAQKGDFGATLGVTLTADKLGDLDLDNIRLYAVLDGKIVRLKDAIIVNDDGTVTILMDQGTSYIITDQKLK